MARKARLGRLIRMPRIPWSCRLDKRVAARNAIGSVIRALKAGKCKRAKLIMGDSDFHWAVRCVDRKTIERIDRRAAACKER
jgi:hypothetical protein